MLESLVAKVINSYVGRYFENINADQLSFGLLQGSVELDDLPLKPSAVNEIDLPIRVMAGSVAKFKLNVPMTQLKSSPWNISIDGLLLVVGAKEAGRGVCAKKDLLTKQKALDEIEKTFKESLKSSAAGLLASSYWFDFSAIVANIVNNLQITVTNIHVRYENFNNLEKQQFSLGFILEKLEIRSTDENWNPAFVASSKIAHKTGNISKLCVYLDHRETNFEQQNRNLKSYFDWLKQNGGFSSGCLLNIIDCGARYFRNLSTQPLKSKSKPRISLELTINELPVQVCELQVRCLLYIFNEIERYDRSKFFKKSIPTEPIIGHAKLWWQYAYKCTLQLLSLPTSLENTLKSIRSIISYVHIYANVLHDIPLSAPEKSQQLEFENSRDLDIIIKLRGIAFDKVKKRRLEAGLLLNNGEVVDEIDSGNSASGRGWFDWWYGRNMEKEDDTGRRSSEAGQGACKTVDEEEFFTIISDAAADCSLRMVDYLYSRIEVYLKSGSVSLVENPTSSSETGQNQNNPPNNLLEMKFTDLVWNNENYPRFHGVMYNLSLNNLVVLNETLDLNCPLICKREVPETYRKGLQALVSPALSPSSSITANPDEVSEETSRKLFEYNYERFMYRPGAFEHKYRLETQPIDVIYDRSIAKLASKFSKLRLQYSSASRLQKEVYQRYSQIKKQTSSNLKGALSVLLEGSAVKSQDRYNILMNVCAPIIYFYENVNDKNSKIVGVDLGKVTFCNEKGRSDAENPELLENEKLDEIGTDSDDDLFMTPCSTPKSPKIVSPATVTFGKQTVASRDAVDAKEQMVNLYKRYRLILSDIQVFAGSRSDNWAETFLRSQSSLSLLERFSVRLSLDRSLISAKILEEPNVMVQGSVSEIRLRFSQEKIVAVHNCLKQFAKKKPKPENLDETFQRKSTSSGPGTIRDLSLFADKVDENKLILLCQFSVSLVSVAIHSEDRSLAELHIYSSSIAFKHYPAHTSVKFMIRDVLLVDAFQNYGPQFDLLLASRHDCEDEVPLSAGHQSWDSPIWESCLSGNVPALKRVEMFEKMQSQKGLIEVKISKYHQKHKLNRTSVPKFVCSGNFSRIDGLVNQRTIFELVKYFDKVFAALKSNAEVVSSMSSEFRMPAKEAVAESSSNFTVELDFKADQLNLEFLLAAQENRANKFARLSLGSLSVRLETFINEDVVFKAAMGTFVLDKLDTNSEKSYLGKMKNLPSFRIYVADLSQHESGEPALSVEYIYRTKSCSARKAKLNENVASVVGLTCLNTDTNYSLQVNILTAFSIFDAEFFVSLKACMEELRTYISKIKSSVVSIAKSLASSSKIEQSPVILLVIESPVIVCQDPEFETEALVCHLGALYAQSVESQIDMNLANFKLELSALPDVSPCKESEKQKSIQVSANYYIRQILSSTCLLRVANEISIFCNMSIPVAKAEVGSAFKIDVSVDSEASLSLTKHAVKFMRAVWESVVKSWNEITDSDLKRETEEYKRSLTEEHRYSLFFPNSKAKVRHSMWSAHTKSETEMNVVGIESSSPFSIKLKAKSAKFVLLDYQQCEINSCQLEQFRLSVNKFESSTTEIAIIHSGLVVTDLFSVPKEKVSSFSKSQQTIFEFKPPPDMSSIANITLERAKTPKINLNFTDILLKLNLQTWVHIFDFFSIGTKAHPSLLRLPNSASSLVVSNEPQQFKTFDLSAFFVKIELVLVKPTYNIAKAILENIDLKIGVEPETFRFELELSNFMVVDESPWNKIHTIRLRTYDDKGKIVASFLKYSCPDPDLKKEFDVSLVLRSGKISFVHTTRMLAEINNFFQYLSKMLLMYQFKNADRSGHQMSALKHGARIKLDVEIPQVELVLPYAFDNRDCFVGVLKQLTVKNTFSLLDQDLKPAGCRKSDEGDENTGSQPDVVCLADCLRVKILELDFSTGRVDPGQKVVVVKSLVDQKFDLEINVTRNLDGDNLRSIPDLGISCKIKSIFVSLLESDIQLFKGMLKYNLGENTNDLTWPSDAIYIQSQISSAEKLLTWKKLVLNLKFEDTKFRAFCPTTQKLFAQLSFFNSRLNLITFSDRTSKFELWSSSFLLEDIRCSGDFPTNQRPFSFTSILKPCDLKKQSIPQLQINFLVNSKNKVMSCILSDVELLCNLEWLLLFQQFLLSEPKAIPEQIPVSKCDLFATTRLFASLQHSTASRTLFGGLGTAVAKPGTLGLGAYQQIAKLDSPMKPTGIAKSDEIKVALNDTQIVLLEDVTVLESAAIVVKCSAFLSLSPTSLDKVVKLSVREVQLLSCIYHAVRHTKLSIIEPLNVDIEVHCVDQGLANVPVSATSQKKCQLEMSLSPIVTRLSYQDIVLLVTMVNYYKQVFANATRNHYERNVLANLDKLAFLQEMGYSKELCAEALKKFNGDPNKASIWLVESSLDQSSFEANPGDWELLKVAIDSVRFDLDSMSLFLIDDTKSVDLPLVNFNISACWGRYDSRNKQLKLGMTLLLNSFNPNLSGWESLVEDWSVNFILKTEATSSPKPHLMIQSDQMFNLNVTPFSLEMMSHLKSITQAGFSNCRNVLKARQLFLPYVLQNKLGHALYFATSEGSVLSTSSFSSSKNKNVKWRKVENGNCLQFDFLGEAGRRNVINCSTDSEKFLHLNVVDCSNIAPLSVNEVGTYLRTALSSNPLNRSQERILIEVSFSKQLCKTVITVMSGLEIENCLDVDVAVRFDLSSNRVTPRSEFKIKSKSKFHVPLSLVYASLYLKPDISQCQMYPRRSIEWQNVVTPGSSLNTEVVCVLSDEKLFRYNACIHSKSLIRNPYNIEVAQPSHTVKICPVLIVQNLLPVSFFVDVSNDRDSGLPPITAEVPKRSSTSIHLLDLSETLQFVVRIEGFRHHYPLIIDSEAVGNGLSLLVKLFDTLDRPLSLEANICSTVGGALKIGIYAAYWLVNKTGLPLVFKQLECDWEIPGQSEDNEIATCSTPIMMSFAAGSLRSLKARCGYGRNHNLWRNPRWSSDKIYCDYVKPGHGTINVDQSCDGQNRSSRSHLSVDETVSYNLSYEVLEGRDDYASTTFIILRPTYMLYNETANQLVFKQAGMDDVECSGRSYTVLSGSCTSFQWISSTVTELMSVKLASEKSAVWCGGICISESASFDIYLRTTDSDRPNFIVHVDVVQKHSQCLVYFWDNCLPPQYIIENRSDVDLQIRQYDAPSHIAEHYTSLIPANKSLPYCLDFPLQNARLLCNVTGSSHPATIDLDDETESITLLYETFSIFGFLPVNDSVSSNRAPKPCLSAETLVLDVSGTGQALLQPRSAVRNDQVWRMMPNGMIRNEGRSKPFDYEKVVDGVLIRGSYVLDVSMQRKPSSSVTASTPRLSLPKGIEMHPLLCVRQADPRSRSQMWRIDSEGRLVNQYYAKSACPIKLESQSFVTLEDLNTKCNNSVWKLAKFQLKPGSGKLTTRMIFQGPTRTLIVEDSHVNSLQHKDWNSKSDQPSFISRLEVILSEGVSVSVMNKTPEELLYVALQCVCCRYYFATKRTNAKFEMNVVSIQIDNQLHNSFRNQQVMFRSEPSGYENRKAFCLDVACEMDRKMEYENCKIIQLFSIHFENSVILIVERLLFKIIQFIEQVLGPKNQVDSWNPLDLINASPVTPSKSKLFLQHFSVSKFSITATAHLSRNMSADLLEIKSKYKIILLSFDGAKVTFRAFNRKGIMQSSDMFLKDLAAHYRKAAENQAMHIIGHVDLLGNPIGLLKDVNTGVRQIDNTADSVSNFARFVTNRMSKNTSKFAESLSDTIGSFIFTEQDQEQRQLFRESYSNGIANNISGGVIGLFKGVSDGVTGVAMQPYRGLRDGGVVGGLTGVVRGFTGVIAKPSIGVLDFAYFAANAMSYTTSIEGANPARLRCPRCCSYCKLISTYDYNLARSQEFLYQLNGFDLSEKLIALESVFIDPDAMKRMLITNARVLLIQNSSPEESNVTMELFVEKLHNCTVIPRNGVERCVLVIDSHISEEYENMGFEESSHRVDCESSQVAYRLKSLIEYTISKYRKDSFTFK